MAQRNLELRVIVSKEHRYAVHTSVTTRGHDIYVTDFPKTVDGELSRLSYHASGQVHFKILEYRVGGATHEAPPSELRGSHQLTSISGPLDKLDWTYRPRSGKGRHNLIVDLDQLKPPTFAVEVWAIERGRRDLADEVLRRFADQQEVLGELLVEHTDLQLLAFAWTANQRTLDGLRKSMETHRWAKGNLRPP